MDNRTEGEVLFEQYLGNQGLAFEFEKEYPGKAKRPDYSIDLQGRTILLDVKDFERPVDFHLGGGAFDPYPPVREKIEQARDKFKEYKEYCCALVLRNLGNPKVDLEFPDIMLGAMYGDAGFTFPVNTKTGIGNMDLLQRAFLGRGKMVRPNWSKAQNTTVSAIVTLTRIQPDFQKLVEMMKANPGLDVEVCDAQLRNEDPDFDPERFIPRVIVWHNAFARIPFPSDLFCGPYDCHFGIRGEQQGVTYRGSKLPPHIRPVLPKAKPIDDLGLTPGEIKF